MSKQDFLSQLHSDLSRELDSASVQNNVRYYEDYINMQIRSGRSEGDVLRELGDPRLISRSIVSAASVNASGNEERSDYGSYYDNDNSYRESYGNYGSYGNRSTYENNDRVTEKPFLLKALEKFMALPRWVRTSVKIIAAVFFFTVIIRIFSFLLPIMIPVVLVYFCIKLFCQWLS
ncbi:MAG: DUF1700 domain-containing protein [Lachnospiraceae bacterium]|nr:DUF1700 domain-containing protein [Lachnospiraceae bacterium]